MEYCFGAYRLKVNYFGGGHGKAPDGAQVSMYDLGQIRFPMVWSKTMSLEKAKGAIELFSLVGYFDMPVG